QPPSSTRWQMASRRAPGLSTCAMSAPAGTLTHHGAPNSPFRNSAPSRRTARSASDSTSMRNLDRSGEEPRSRGPDGRASTASAPAVNIDPAAGLPLTSDASEAGDADARLNGKSAARASTHHPDLRKDRIMNQDSRQLVVLLTRGADHELSSVAFTI